MLRVTYFAICAFLITGLGIALKSAMFLARNASNSKDISTPIETYVAWPGSIREEFRQILVQDNGRVKPANTFARFTLLQMNNSSKVKFETADGTKHKLDADEWLMDVLFRSELAKDLPIFNADDTEAVSGLGVRPKPGNADHHKRDRYSYNQLHVARAKLAEEGKRLEEKSENYRNSEKDPQYELSRIEGITLRLSRNVSLFEFLSGQFDYARKAEGFGEKSILPEDLQQLASNFDVTGLMERMPEMELGQLVQNLNRPAQDNEERTIQAAFQLYFYFANTARHFTILPPEDTMRDKWYGAGDALITGMENKAKRPWVKEQIDELTKLYESQRTMWSESKTGTSEITAKPVATLLRSFVDKQHSIAATRKQARYGALSEEIKAAGDAFEKERLTTRQKGLKVEGAKASQEVSLLTGGAFTKSLVYFIFGFVILAVSWLVPGSKFARFTTWIATALLVFALFYNVFGITMRSIIRSRPPITNLYDTIIFITGVVVFLALMIEWFTRRGIGLLLAALCGAGGMFLSIRYEVKEASDTMDPLQAVLDTNLWLATHVTTINIGYAAGMLAAFLGTYYLLYRFLRPLGGILKRKNQHNSDLFLEDKNSRDYAKTIAKMTYGIVCFCLFFSLIGTVLGGIWANYSWGRFWGWDPKENGALMICLWTLVILHMRLGGYVKDIGIAILSIILGIIVTFSWWGVNNLGVGLHSYGFTEGVWPALFVSWAEAGLIMFCGLPLWLHGKLKQQHRTATRLKQQASPA